MGHGGNVNANVHGIRDWLCITPAHGVGAGAKADSQWGRPGGEWWPRQKRIAWAGPMCIGGCTAWVLTFWTTLASGGGGLANNGQYFDIITGQPLDLSNACYINDDLLVNCGDSGIGTPQPAGPITDVSQTAAYIAANAAANAAYVPPATAPPGYTITQPNLAPPSTGTGNPLTGSNTNTTTALSPGSTVNGTSTSGSAASTCSGIGMGPCIGPLDAGTWGLIAVGALMLVMVMNK